MVHLSSFRGCSHENILKHSESSIENLSSLTCHELRTTLTSIKGVLTLLNHEQFAHFSEDGERLLGIANNAVDRLARLADILDHKPEALPSMLSIDDLKSFCLSNDLIGALSRQEISLNYQPIISVSDEKIIGFEALAR